MNRKEKAFAWLFAAVMLLFSLFLSAWVVLRADLDFRLEDTAISLDTSRGRERKQTQEYEQVQKELLEVLAELEEAQPLADASAGRLSVLKETRKALRAEKKALEEAAAETNDPGSPDPDVPDAPELPAEEGTP